MNKGIFILSTARSTSTTLFTILRQAVPPGTPVLLEPFSQPYYVQNNLTATPGFTFQSRLPTTVAGALARIKQSHPSLVKDLSHQCYAWLTYTPPEEIAAMLNSFTFLFLIRSPTLTIPSAFYPYVTAHQETAFGATDVGLTQLRTLFDFIAHHTGKVPLVLEAEAYLAAPEQVLPPYFAALGLPWHPACLTWQPMTDAEVAADADFSLWGDTWFRDLRLSKGVTRPPNEQTYVHTVDNTPQLQAIYAQEAPAYIYLKTQGTRPPAMNGVNTVGAS